MQLLWLVVCLFGSGGVGDSNELVQPFPVKPAKIMVFGTFHLDQATNVDVMTPQKQNEIVEIVKLLAAFRPTKIALETLPKDEAAFNQAYAEYLAGTFELKPNERYQIGFRLAKMMGHDRLYAVDNKPPELGAMKDFGWDFGKWEAYLRDIGQWDDFMRHADTIQANFERQQQSQGERPLLEHLRFLNSAANKLHRKQRFLMMEAKAGVGENWLGSDFLARWYQRNLRIFSLTATLRDSENDRILLIIGVGHAGILEDFFRDSPEFELVDPLDVLKN